jgi:hypothetical protein
MTTRDDEYSQKSDGRSKMNPNPIDARARSSRTSRRVRSSETRRHDRSRDVVDTVVVGVRESSASVDIIIIIIIDPPLGKING